MRDELTGLRKVPVRRERLTIERIVGGISLAIFSRTIVQVVSIS